VTDRLLRLPEVKATTGLGSSTIYRYIQAGTFPAPVKIGGHAARWRSSELAAWMDGLVHSECAAGVRDVVAAPGTRKIQQHRQ
jgi:prophage regulatory protein